MDSDLPLMELEEEDDSLILPFPDLNQARSKSSLNCFTCSPCALPSSHTKNLKDSVRMEKPCSSSSEASNNKENINSNSVEVPKLGMEPMQMKRRKKGGGYNLRKSLAWDRAFFTDEGILDPLELTLITGINGGLPTISEEGNSSRSSDVRCTNEFNDTEASKKAPLKEFNDKNRISYGNKEKTVGNHDSLPHHKDTHKALSSNRTNRGGPKVGGCSEPLTAPSLKRPANSNTMKTAKKESKLPKLPISKPGSCFPATTKGSMSASQLRHNTIPKPTIHVQKNVGLKSFVKNVHGSQIKEKTGSGSLQLSALELAQKPVKSVKNSSKAASSTNLLLVQVDKANSGSEMVPGKLQLCDIQEEPARLAAKNLGQHTATDSNNNSLVEAVRLTCSGPTSDIQRASKGPMISDGLHPCESQLARPSGLRLPSPSLRFFDQKTASESGSLTYKKLQQCNTSSMGSNRKICELRPPAAARTPMKITENECCAPSTPYGSTLSPNYMGNTGKGSNIYANLESKFVPRVDIINECRGSELIEQEKSILRHEESVKTDKIAACKGDERIKISRPTEHLEVASIHLVGNVGYNNNNKVGVGTCLSEGNDERVPLVSETKHKSVLHNDGDGLRSCTAFSMPTSGQSIQHQEYNISTGVNETSWDTEKSDDAPKVKVDSESHLDAGRQVFVGSDGIRKRKDDDVKWVAPGLGNYSVDEKIGQENDDVAKVVDDKSLPMEDDNPCKSGTNGRIISITSRDFLEDEGEGDVTELIKGIVDTSSCIPSQNMNTEQGNDDADSVDTKSPLKNVVHPSTCMTNKARSLQDTSPVATLLLNDYISAEPPTTSIKNKDKIHDNSVRDAVTLLQHDNPSTESAEGYHFNPSPSTSIQLLNVSQINDTLLQEKSDSNCSSAIAGRKQDGVIDVHLIPTLIDDCHYQSSLSNLIEFISETTSVGDDALVKTESVVPATYPQSLEKEKQDIETEMKIHEENHKSQDKSQHSQLTGQGCAGGSKTYSQFQSENQTLEHFSNNSETNVENAQLQLLDGDVLGQSCSRLTSQVHKDSIHNVDHSDILGKHPELSYTVNFQQEFVCKGVRNVVDGNECDPKPSNTIRIVDAAVPPTEHGDKMFVEKSTYSAGEESCSFPMPEENTTLFGTFLDDRVSTEKIDKPNNALDSVPEESINSQGCDLEYSNAGSAQILQENVSHLNGDDQPQDFVETMPSKIISTGEEVDAQVLHKGKTPHELDGIKNAAVLIKRSNSIKRQDKSLVIHPPNAVPFSDEWLAAIEAAGEEILTMKCGAVQHSPPDKSLPEPSPWSPVKKKTNQIGPYDCTKYTNVMPSSSH